MRFPRAEADEDSPPASVSPPPAAEAAAPAAAGAAPAAADGAAKGDGAGPYAPMISGDAISFVRKLLTPSQVTF